MLQIAGCLLSMLSAALQSSFSSPDSTGALIVVTFSGLGTVSLLAFAADDPFNSAQKN
jgi:hypothetical protein